MSNIVGIILLTVYFILFWFLKAITIRVLLNNVPSFPVCYSSLSSSFHRTFMQASRSFLLANEILQQPQCYHVFSQDKGDHCLECYVSFVNFCYQIVYTCLKFAHHQQSIPALSTFRVMPVICCYQVMQFLMSQTCSVLLIFKCQIILM